MVKTVFNNEFIHKAKALASKERKKTEGDTTKISRSPDIVIVGKDGVAKIYLGDPQFILED